MSDTTQQQLVTALIKVLEGRDEGISAVVQQQKEIHELTRTVEELQEKVRILEIHSKAHGEFVGNFRNQFYYRWYRKLKSFFTSIRGQLDVKNPINSYSSYSER